MNTSAIVQKLSLSGSDQVNYMITI